MRIAFMLGCDKILLMNTTRYWGGFPCEVNYSFQPDG